jgi:formimidoylglutamate deiminase
MPPSRYWARRAWIDGSWREHVLLEAGADGHWLQVCPDTPEAPGAETIDGAVIPSLVNAHSHAFQRAFVGLAERRDSAHDDFWSWRDRMYGVALRITPAQLCAVAAQVYVELLAGGYTQVCEFHYLHHQADGSVHADPAEMSWALADAAAEAGIGLTLLPVLYERSGFTADGLRDDQRRFCTDVPQVLSLQRAVRMAARPLLSSGVAVHSLRAAPALSIRSLAERSDGPLHIHLAEQQAEVRDCLAATGARPIEWLLRNASPDARWQLVHATHSMPSEVDGVARCGAGVVLCPGTEANLGDGAPDLPGWLAAGVPLSVGSDSQVTRQWPEELRWLEYAQRLHRQQRNVAADPGRQPATAARLFDRMLRGGPAAAGFTRWGLQTGARADLLVLNGDESALCGLPNGHTLDGVIFAAPAQPFLRVMVAGRWVATSSPAVTARHAAAMQSLWQAASSGDTPR